MTIIQRSVLLVLLFSGFINAALIEQNNAHAIGGTVGHGGWFTWTGSRLDTISIVPGENSVITSYSIHYTKLYEKLPVRRSLNL